MTDDPIFRKMYQFKAAILRSQCSLERKEFVNFILTFIRAVVTEEGSCAPKIFYVDFYVFI